MWGLGLDDFVEHLRQYGAKSPFGICHHRIRAPRDDLVGTNENDAIFINLAQSLPIEVQVSNLTTWPDNDALEWNPHLLGNFFRRRCPLLAGDTGDQCEL